MRNVIHCCLTIFLILILFNTLLASPESDEIFDLINSAKEEIYFFRLNNSLNIFHTIQTKYPDHPHGYFYESYITILLYFLDESNDSLENRLQVTIKKAIGKSESYREKYKNDPEAFFYLGVSHGLSGIYAVLNRNYFSGYIHARKGITYLKKTIEIDSTYYDAFLGLGIYHYYIDLLPGIIKFFTKILGLGGDREKGLKEIVLAKEKGKFFKVEAEFTYGAVRYFLEGAKQEALSILQRLKMRYFSNPAFTLFIGYYYRRKGDVKTALSYFNIISDDHKALTPLIYLMKYYNIGVCYFRLNNFSHSENVFLLLSHTPTRISAYYKAAIAYYLGLLADLNFNRKSAEEYLNSIRKSKKTEYWYYVSRLHVNLPMDSLLYYYISVENSIFTANFTESLKGLNKIKKLTLGRFKPDDSQIIWYLIRDIEGRYEFRRGNIINAQKVYKTFINRVHEINDEFQKAWIYIQYARVLSELRDWDSAKKFLKRASDCGDDYTKLIIERELFIIKHTSNIKKQVN
jgi:tetratricopeptide (TPR) repeat protein